MVRKLKRRLLFTLVPYHHLPLMQQPLPQHPGQRRVAVLDELLWGHRSGEGTRNAGNQHSCMKSQVNLG